MGIWPERRWAAVQRGWAWLAGRGHAVGLVGLLAVLAIVPRLVPPGGEFPVDDDWAYTRAVQQVLETGSYQRSVWIDTALVAQAWWGALVSDVLGFSHTSLRLGTLLLAAIALILFYRLLGRALGPALALGATLLLLFHPLLLHLAYTFMTDVPFLATTVASIWCVCHALESRRGPDSGGRRGGGWRQIAWLAAGSGLIGLACLVRQIGIVLVPAVLIGALPELRGAWAHRGSRWRLLLVLGAPFAVVIGTAALSMGPRDTGVEVRFVDLLRSADPASVLHVALRETAASATLLGLSAMPAMPLIWMCLRLLRWTGCRRLWTATLLLLLAWAIGDRAGGLEIGAAPAMLAVVVILPWHWIGARGQLRTWMVRAGVAILLAEVLAATFIAASRSEGGMSSLFGNTLSAAGLTTSGLHPHAIVLDGLATTMLGALGLVGAMTLVVMCGNEAPPPSPLPIAMERGSYGTPSPSQWGGGWGEGLPALPIRLLVLSSAGVLVVTLGYGPIGGPVNGLYDRYLLPVLPGVLALAAYAVRERRLAAPLFLAGALLFAGWSVSWQREYLARQTAVWTAAEALVAQGIEPSEIDAGYEWAGWTRGDAVIEQARAAALEAGEPRQFVQLVVDGLYKPHGWYVGFGPLGYGCAGQPLVTVPYGDGSAAYGLRRCRPWDSPGRAGSPRSGGLSPDQPPIENDTSSP